MVVSFIKKQMTEEEIEERAKKYDQEQEENRVKRAAYMKEYYQEHKQKVNEQSREYRIQNRAKLNEQQQQKRRQKQKIRDVFKYDLIKFCEKHPSDFYKTGLKML